MDGTKNDYLSRMLFTIVSTAPQNPTFTARSQKPNEQISRYGRRYGNAAPRAIPQSPGNHPAETIFFA